MLYTYTYAYASKLSGELFNSVEEAKARDVALLAERLGGLAPGDYAKILANGMSDAESEMFSMLRQLAAEAAYRVPSVVEVTSVPSVAEIEERMLAAE